MSDARAHLGDAHNFGRRVRFSGARVAKPRTLLWEWLFLSSSSPLRAALGDAAARAGLGADAFAFLPDLAFSSHDDVAGGEVDWLTLEPLAFDTDKSKLAIVVGRALALFSWMGVSDLHWENLALGQTSDGRVVFTPLDVELVLSDMAMPTETKLLPDADPEIASICAHAAGVRRVLPFLGKPVPAGLVVTIAAAYVRTLELLDTNAPAIASAFGSLPRLIETPIRVLLRGTDEYVAARAGRPVDPPLLAAERTQLDRGDIPYFFRCYGQPGIRWFSTEDLSGVETIPARGDVPRLDALLRIDRDLRSPRRKKLREEGLFAVLGAFDSRENKGRHEADGLAVTFRGRTLVVERAGDELETRRDLSAFVGSVHLPCRCGEVESVFVPAVTVCETPPRARRSRL